MYLTSPWCGWRPSAVYSGNKYNLTLLIICPVVWTNIVTKLLSTLNTAVCSWKYQLSFKRTGQNLETQKTLSRLKIRTVWWISCEEVIIFFNLIQTHPALSQNDIFVKYENILWSFSFVTKSCLVFPQQLQLCHRQEIWSSPDLDEEELTQRQDLPWLLSSLTHWFWRLVWELDSFVECVGCMMSTLHAHPLIK